jgi:hypothetical protein
MLTTILTASLAWADEKPQAEWIPAYSGNYSKGRTKAIEYIILHTIEGSTTSGINTFRNRRKGRRKVSAHYIVGRDGRIVQMVKDSDSAWHIRRTNSNTIGIEHEGWADRNTWTEVQYRASARLTRWLCLTYDVPMTRERIRGHGEMPGQSHRHDPGRYFDWDLYMRLVRQEDQAPTLAGVAPAQDQVLGRNRIRPLQLRWVPAPEQTNYQALVEDLSSGERFDSGRRSGSKGLHVSGLELAHERRYRWRVITFNAQGASAGATPWVEFQVDLTPPKVELISPAPDEWVATAPRFRWSHVDPDAPPAGYRVWVIDRDGTVVMDTLQLNGPATSYEAPFSLPGGDYRYRVMVIDGRGNRALSTWRPFRSATPLVDEHDGEPAQPVGAGVAPPLGPNHGIIELVPPPTQGN